MRKSFAYMRTANVPTCEQFYAAPLRQPAPGWSWLGDFAKCAVLSCAVKDETFRNDYYLNTQHKTWPELARTPRRRWAVLCMRVYVLPCSISCVTGRTKMHHAFLSKPLITSNIWLASGWRDGIWSVQVCVCRLSHVACLVWHWPDTHTDVGGFGFRVTISRSRCVVWTCAMLFMPSSRFFLTRLQMSTVSINGNHVFNR